MNEYRLIWITDIGCAGSDPFDYPTVAAAQAAASSDVRWTQEGREWSSTRDQYGDCFVIKPLRS